MNAVRCCGLVTCLWASLCFARNAGLLICPNGRENSSKADSGTKNRIAAIQDSAEGYKQTTSHSAIERAAQRARIEALEKIQQELASLRPKRTS